MRRGSVWVSFAVLWTAYALMFTGYAWVRGYDLPFLQIVGPVNYYKGPWPPGKSIPPTQIFPGKTQSASSPNQA